MLYLINVHTTDQCNVQRIFVEGPTIDDTAWEISSDKVLLGGTLSNGYFGKVCQWTVQEPITTPYTIKL